MHRWCERHWTCEPVQCLNLSITWCRMMRIYAAMSDRVVWSVTFRHHHKTRLVHRTPRPTVGLRAPMSPSPCPSHPESVGFDWPMVTPSLWKLQDQARPLNCNWCRLCPPRFSRYTDAYNVQGQLSMPQLFSQHPSLKCMVFIIAQRWIDVYRLKADFLVQRQHLSFSLHIPKAFFKKKSRCGFVIFEKGS